MSSDIYSVITGTGSYIPTEQISNDNFLKNQFFDRDGKLINNYPIEIIKQ